MIFHIDHNENSQNFLISKWAELFLTTKGTNILEGDIENNTLIINQVVPKSSDGLQKQKLDILFFNEESNVSIKSVVISDEDCSSSIKIEDTLKYFILNHGDHANALIVLNNETFNFLFNNMNIIKDSLTRNLVWKAVQTMVKLCKINSIEYFKFLITNIFNEPETLLIETELDTAKDILDAYIPDEKYEQVSSEMFESIYSNIK